MGKWNVGLPPVGGWLWSVEADILKIDLPDDMVYLLQGPIQIELPVDPGWPL